MTLDANGSPPSPDRMSEKRPDKQYDADRRPSPVTILVVAVLVVGGGLFLTMKLREMSRLQDCLMSGRTNCAPIETPNR